MINSLEYLYLCRDGEWRECNREAIVHIIDTLKIKNLEYVVNPDYPEYKKKMEETLEFKIDTKIKASMIAKDADTLRALRGLKSAIMVEKTAKNAPSPFTDESVMNVIQSQIKKRKESLDIYKTQNREDLAVIEETEINVMTEFLPKQMSVEELKPIISKVVAEVGATSNKDMGRVMSHADILALNGKADKKTISELIKAEFPT